MSVSRYNREKNAWEDEPLDRDRDTVDEQRAEYERYQLELGLTVHEVPSLNEGERR